MVGPAPVPMALKSLTAVAAPVLADFRTNDRWLVLIDHP
jgi:hypothetical protein